VVPEEADPAVRELFVFHQRYRMLYEIVEESGEVRVLAFIHSARDLATALEEQPR
jgi:plasmid stabilization system protein ParE